MGRSLTLGLALLMSIFLACGAPPATADRAAPAASSVPPSIATAPAAEDALATAPRHSVEPGPAPERLRVRVLERHPHDPDAFTQGLVWHEDRLYESVGRYGRSGLRRVDPTTGRVEQHVPLEASLFGEGLARVGDRLIQLTWKAGLGAVYDLATLTPVDWVSYDGEGWGLAYDGSDLWMSNGSPRLLRRDPETFAVRDVRVVTLAGEPLPGLNELEFARDALYANVWTRDEIVRIDPATGRVTAVIDASGLLTPRERRRVDVLNGIAYDPRGETFWITGKLWPAMFHVVFEPLTAER
ncbi:MAG: glutaminyl-peptide cyclotransferase [Acidobacteriota bacterium]